MLTKQKVGHFPTVPIYNFPIYKIFTLFIKLSERNEALSAASDEMKTLYSS